MSHKKRSTAVPSSFRALYKEECDKFYMCSRRTLLSKIPADASSLDLCVDIIRAEEWKPLLHALPDVGRLQLVQESIHVPALFTPEMLKLFCSVLSEHLKNNTRLKSLELVGFPLSLVHLQELSAGIRASASIAGVTFDDSSLGKQGLEALCHALCEREGVHVLSLCNCRLGCTEARLLAWLLQQQSLGRQGALWQGALRQGALALDSLRGLRRLSLCRNPLGDEGVCALAEALRDNLCLKALDLQSCNAGSAGASALLDLLQNNVVLEVVDIRQNPNIDADLARDVGEKVSSNRHGRQCQYDVLPLGKSQPLPPCHQRSRSTGRLQERKSARGKLRSSSLGRAATAPLAADSPSPHVAKHVEEDLRRCQESLRREQEARQMVERKLLELFEENRQLRSQQCKGCQQPGYSLIANSLLKDIERAFLKFQVLLAARKHTEDRNPTETGAARPGESVHSSTKDFTADPSALNRSLHGPAPTENPVTSKPPEYFQEFVQSKAKLIISERSGTADLTSSTTHNKQAHRKHTTSSVKPEVVGQSRSKLSNASATESSKRLSELLGIDQVPSKLVPSTLGSPDFFPMETFDSEAGLLKYQRNASVASTLSEDKEKRRAAPQKPNNTESTFTNSSRDSTLVSSIQEQVVSTSSAVASYKQPPAAVVSTADHHSQESDTVSLSPVPSRSFEIHTADITVSSIHSSTMSRKAAKISLRHSQQRHSTPTLSNSTSRGVFEVISTPSNVSLSQNQSEVSTPSTPDTATPPQLAGSDFDGF
ncbi:hypothetical protein MTO96_019255 [Rhipicephalus appendiculatus]